MLMVSGLLVIGLGGFSTALGRGLEGQVIIYWGIMTGCAASPGSFRDTVWYLEDPDGKG